MLPGVRVRVRVTIRVTITLTKRWARLQPESH